MKTLAGVNYVKLIDLTDKSSIIEALRADDTFAAHNIIEAEPRRILDGYEKWREKS